MAETSSIEWTDATWNPVTGCSVVSPGCTNCYAMKLAGTRLQHHPSRKGLTVDSKAGPVWNGQVRLNEEWLDQPTRWKRPRRIFVCAHGDLFHESVPIEWIDQVFAVMAIAQHHTFQVLTKRAARMREYLSDPGMVRRVIAQAFRRDCDAGAWMSADHQIAGDPIFPLPNVWLGVSAEDQTRADERIPDLICTPAAVRFVSIEPMVGPVDLTNIQAPKVAPDDDNEGWKFSALETGEYYQFKDSLGYWEGGDGPDRPHRIDWVIVGGESGSGARPVHPEWVRSLRKECSNAEVAFFFKQWGEWAPICAMSEEQVERCYHPAPIRQPEASRRCKVATDVLQLDGSRGDPFHYPKGAMMVMAIGKKAAGRLLDGIEHNAMPKASNAPA